MQAGDGTNPRARLHAQQREHNMAKARESEYARENLGKYLGKQGELARWPLSQRALVASALH
jgi:hypothetical protein